MDQLKKVLGTSFYIGYLPLFPGTWASLFVLFPLYFIFKYGNQTGIAIAVIFFSLITLCSAYVCEREWGKDPSQFVMDEWAGQTLTFFLISNTVFAAHSVIILLTGFVLFRIFDIIKPFGVYKLQKFPGGWGILLDDLLAGLYANICLEMLILFILPKLFI